MTSELLTVAEVARECKVHPVTVRRLIARGSLPAVRIGRSVRVRREDLDGYSGRRPYEVEGGRRKTGIIEWDDPLYRLIGMISDPDASDLSVNKYKYLYPDPGKRD